MQAILKLAYKLLVNDKAKLSGLLVGITFAVFLMIEMTSLFAGVLNRSSSAVYNIGARMFLALGGGWRGARIGPTAERKARPSPE